MEFVGVSKRSTNQDFAEITLVKDATKDLLLRSPIFIAGVRVIASVSSTTPGPNLASNALTTMLIVKGLPI
jgi:hypothetical protein